MKLNISRTLSTAAAMILTMTLCSAGCTGEPKPTPGPDPVNPGGGTETPATNGVWVTGDVQALQTTNNRALDLKATAIKFSATDNMSPRTVTLQPSTRYQEIDGFGAAITGSTAYNLMKMSKDDRQAFLQQTFDTDKGYGMSYIRICIGCSDFSLSEYTCCDKPGLENFGLTDEETKYVIPVLKEILAINPKLKIMGSPWTAPRWMKVNNLTERKPYDGWTSGQLNPAHYNDYADYFIKWIKAFEAQGIKIHAVTLQNEPLNRGNSASMFMGWQEQRDFLKQAVGPRFAQAGITAKVYAFDHNYNYDNMADQQQYPAKIYADAEAAKYVAGAAYHNYGGNKSELLTMHDKYPGKELIFTESTAGDWNDGSNLSKRLVDDMNEICLGTVNNWCRGAVIWNLMLDTKRGPNRPGGCTTGFGAVDLQDNNKTVRRNSFYYIMAHMAGVAKPGAYRIATGGFKTPEITSAAFANPDGSYGYVASNSSGKDVSFTLDDGKHHFTVTVPANGIASFKW